MPQYDPREQYRELCCAILQLAISDWRGLESLTERTRRNRRRRLLRFFRSAWFETLCTIVAIPAENIRERLGIKEKGKRETIVHPVEARVF